MQEIFNVKSLDLSNDLVPSETRGYPMQAGDALTLGKGAYKKERFQFAKKWLEVASVLWREGRRTEDDDIVEVLDYLSFVEYKVSEVICTAGLDKVFSFLVAKSQNKHL